MFCMALWPGLNRFRCKFEEKRLEIFACTNNVSLDLLGVADSTGRAVAFLLGELDTIVIMANVVIVANPQGRCDIPVWTLSEEFSLIERVDAHIAEEGRVTLVGIPLIT